MKKQTAVEWLVDKLKSQGLLIGELDNLVAVNQAKAMEKEQIEDAYWEGGQDVPINAKQCESYYNETYNK